MRCENAKNLGITRVLARMKKLPKILFQKGILGDQGKMESVNHILTTSYLEGLEQGWVVKGKALTMFNLKILNLPKI